MNYTVTQEQNVTFIYMRQILLQFFQWSHFLVPVEKISIIVMTIHFEQPSSDLQISFFYMVTF